MFGDGNQERFSKRLLEQDKIENICVYKYT